MTSRSAILPPPNEGGREYVDAPRYRVIQWATGNTGQRALREVIRHPSLELVGVRVYDDGEERRRCGGVVRRGSDRRHRHD